MANKIFSLRDELAVALAARDLFRKERDEAREAACFAFDLLRERFWHTSIEDWEEKYPFMRKPRPHPPADLEPLDISEVMNPR